MTDQEWYDYGQAHCGIEVGDRVKVLRKARDREMRWGTFWVFGMDSSVNKVLTVQANKGGDGFLLSDTYCYPFFVLELVEKAESESPLPQSILDIIEYGNFGNVPKASIKKLVAEILKQK